MPVATERERWGGRCRARANKATAPTTGRRLLGGSAPCQVRCHSGCLPRDLPRRLTRTAHRMSRRRRMPCRPPPLGSGYLSVPKRNDGGGALPSVRTETQREARHTRTLYRRYRADLFYSADFFAAHSAAHGRCTTGTEQTCFTARKLSRPSVLYGPMRLWVVSVHFSTMNREILVRPGWKMLGFRPLLLYVWAGFSSEWRTHNQPGPKSPQRIHDHETALCLFVA
jgi:hypothetical protein